MNRRPALLSAPLNLLIALCLLLPGCGGGGGDASPPGTGTPPPGQPPSGPAGSLWHVSYVSLGYGDPGAFVSRLDGSLPTRLPGTLSPHPGADGSSYLTADWNVYDDFTDVKGFDLAAGTQQSHHRFPYYLRGLKLHPGQPRRFIGTWSEDSVSAAEHVIYDLAQNRLIGQTAVDGPMTWTSQGQLLRLRRDGRITRSDALDGRETELGRLQLPAGFEAFSVDVSPTGERIALVARRYTADGGVDESDVFTAGLDGGDLRRFSNTRIGGSPHWSPDGRWLAIEIDEGFVCGGFHCVGRCMLRYAEAGASNLTGLDAVGDMRAFTVKDRHGRDTRLGCGLTGWTP